jgi:hypothetical protein
MERMLEVEMKEKEDKTILIPERFQKKTLVVFEHLIQPMTCQDTLKCLPEMNIQETMELYEFLSLYEFHLWISL